tara:strand:- start:13081 stop:13299 length:219 start_codon:yes stop_codon:yes gene_type:complete
MGRNKQSKETYVKYRPDADQRLLGCPTDTQIQMPRALDKQQLLTKRKLRVDSKDSIYANKGLPITQSFKHLA